MKLTELKTPQGTGYGSLSLDVTSSKEIQSILKDIGVANGINDLHITLIYDRSNPTIDMQLDKNNKYSATISGVKLLGEPGTKWYAITLILTSPEIVKRHTDYINAGFKHSYPDFVPHMSLKYKPTDEDVEKIKKNLNLFKDLKLVFSNEKLAPIKEG